MTPKEMITVEKEVYDAVLRNSVRVNDLEAENAQLHKFLEEFNALDVAKENQQLKDMLYKCREMLEEYQYYEGDFIIGDNAEIDTSLLLKMIDNAIGEKK